MNKFKLIKCQERFFQFFETSRISINELDLAARCEYETMTIEKTKEKRRTLDLTENKSRSEQKTKR